MGAGQSWREREGGRGRETDAEREGRRGRGMQMDDVCESKEDGPGEGAVQEVME